MREIISTEKAPKAIGPYSQAVKWNGMLFLAGQIPLDPETMKVVDGDIAAQTHRVLENLRAVLEAAGSDLSKVLKTTVYLQDMNEFPAMNTVYGEYFPQDPPARSTIQAAGLPKNVRVEIDVIAIA